VLAGCESNAVLVYHEVVADDDPARFVSAAQLDAHIAMLEDEGFTLVSLSQLEAIELDGRGGPSKPCALTFDDGELGFYQHAYPVLRSRGVPATLFLIASRLGEDEGTRVVERHPHVIWPEVLEMQAHGIEMQSHTVNHVRLTDLDDAALERELGDSKRQLEARLGRPVTAVAYPFGVSSPRVRGAAEAAGYRSGYSVAAGLDEPMGRVRISVFGSTGVEELRARVAGTWWGESSIER